MSQHTGITAAQIAVSVAGALLAPATYGLSAVAADAGQTAELPRVIVPPGMKRVLDPILGMPFRLGARDPQTGYLDCLGVVLYAYRTGLNLHLVETADGTNIEPHRDFECVWNSRSPTPSAHWLRLAQTWDMLAWIDPRANQALQGAVPTGTLVLHVGLLINPGAVLSASIQDGVGFRYATELAATYGPHILALFRPRGISPWEPAHEAAPA